MALFWALSAEGGYVRKRYSRDGRGRYVLARTGAPGRRAALSLDGAGLAIFRIAPRRRHLSHALCELVNQDDRPVITLVMTRLVRRRPAVNL